jgi:hypothetical protein
MIHNSASAKLRTNLRPLLWQCHDVTLLLKKYFLTAKDESTRITQLGRINILTGNANATPFF